MRRHRPVMTALRNPMFPQMQAQIPQIQIRPGALQPLQAQLPLQAAPAAPAAQPAPMPGAQVQQSWQWSPYWQPQSYWATGAASSWLPASSGPQPAGATAWVVWTGGTTGVRRYAGSNVSEPVTITSQIFGGPTGVMVTVAPLLAYASNPSHAAAHRERNQPGHQRSTTGEKVKSTLKNIVRMSHPMRHIMAHETTHISRQHNPPDCSDASTPADQCKWICLPMPSPNDPGDEHCVRVPRNARLRGSYFTMAPGVRRTLVQRIKDRFAR